MHIDGETKYAVVQFLELPYANIDDYVCVPHAWIRVGRAKDRRTTVMFPNEESWLTETRIKNCEKPVKEWGVYMAIIKYETYSYSDAKIYIMGKKTVTLTGNEHSDNTCLPDADTDDIRFSIKRFKLSEPQTKTNEEKIQVMSKALPSNATDTQGPEEETFYVPRSFLILKNEILSNYPELDEDFSSLFHNRLRNKSLPTQTSPVQTSRMEFTSQIPSSSNSAEHQDSSTQAMVVDEPTEASCNGQAAQSEQSVEDESFASINSQENVGQSCQSVVMEGEKTTTDQESSAEESDSDDLLTDGSFDDEADQSADTIMSIRDHWKCQLADLFTEMDCEFSQACEVTLELHQAFVRSTTAIKRIRNVYDRFKNEGVKEVTVETPKDVTAPDKEETLEDKERDGRPDKDKNENGGEDDNDDAGDNGSGDEGSKNIEGDEEKEAPKKNRGHIRTFVLPPEFDPNDSRWTLKHRVKDPKLDLVELLPRTRVYISSIRLSHCKRVAKDSKTFARMLLVEIFTQSALSVCSLTGARANAFEVCCTKVRPGLDETARLAIMKFVEMHAAKKNWGVFDTQIVINSIRSKIQEMRAKYGRTE